MNTTKQGTLARLQRLLHGVGNCAAVAREAGVSLRHVYRIRDGGADCSTSIADRLIVAAKRYQRRI